MTENVVLETGLEFDVGQLDDLWEMESKTRKYIVKRYNYFSGNHTTITTRDEKFSDGTKKSNVVTNWIEEIIETFVGSFSESQITKADEVPSSVKELGLDEIQTIERDRDNNLGVESYREVAKYQHLNTLDTELRRDALLYGYAVELHSYNAEEKKINAVRYEPDEWVFVKDTENKVLIAMRRVVLEKGTIFQNEMLEDETEIMTVYTSNMIYTYYRKVDNRNATEIQEKKNEEDYHWKDLDNPQEHYYGQIPVIQWQVKPGFTSIISDALMSQNDEYNEVDSANGDSVKRDVDSLLKIIGFDAEDVKSHEDTIRQKRILALPEDANAEYLTRTFDTEWINARLERTRNHIHSMARIPDVQKIIGVTGSASGIALKLMYTPMENAASEYIKWIKHGIEKRVELLNAMWSKFGGTTLEDYTITIQFLMPVNKIEEWQSIGSLVGEVSHLTRLELLSDISDPTKEMDAVIKERDEMGLRAGMEEPATEEGIQQRSDAEFVLAAKEGSNLEPQIGELIQTLSDAVTDYIMQSGAIDRILKTRKKETEKGTK